MTQSAFPGRNYQAVVDAIEGARLGPDRREDAVARLFLDYFAREHRTNQQVFWRGIQIVAATYADYAADARNEAAVRYATAVAALTPDHYLPSI